MIMVKPADMQLGDTIRCFDGPYGCGTVTKINDGKVTVFRPYAHTSNFSITSGLIPYTGFEFVEYWKSSDAVFPLYERKHIR